MDKNWYKSALYKIHLDLHCPQWHQSILSNFDAKKIVTTVSNTGAKALYFFAKDAYGNAYYNTKIGHKNKCIAGRDILAEVITEAQKVNLPIVAYFCIIFDNHAFDSNPDWQMRNPQGESVKDTAASLAVKWKYVCHNTGYADYIKAMVDEVARNYNIDGLHLDMFNLDFGGLSCYCDACKKLFKEQTGKDLPKEPSTNKTWRQFLEFRYRSVEKLAETLRDTALQTKPDIPVVMNYHGSPDFDYRPGQMPVRHSLYSHMGTGETYTPFFGDMYPGLASRFVRDLVPGKPVELVSWRMNRMTDFTIKPMNQLRWELFTSLASGASTMLIDQPFHDGSLDEVAYDRLKKMFSEIESKNALWTGRPSKHIAIFYSCKNRDLYDPKDLSKFLSPVLGTYKAMTENQFSVGFLFDETLTLENAKQYPLIILPNVAVMSEVEAQIFDQYVKQGGTLIATYDTSLYSETAEKLDNFQLSNVFGIDYAGTNDCDNNYLKNLAAPYGDTIDPRQYILNIGHVHLVKTTTADTYGDLHEAFFKQMYPDRFFSHNMHPPYNRVSDVLYVNKYGKGTAIYLPHQIDASYANTYELPEHRTILRNIVMAHCKPPLVQIDAPLNVEAFINTTKDKILVHLLSFNGLRQAVVLKSLDDAITPSSRMEQPCIYRASLDIKVPFDSVTAFEPTTTINITGSKVKIQCETVHDTITINLK